MSLRSGILTSFVFGLLMVGLVPGASAAMVSDVSKTNILCLYEDGPCIEEREAGPYGPKGYYVCTSEDNCLLTINDGTGCRAFAIYGTDPHISINPVLGIITIDPDSCLDGIVEEYIEFLYVGTWDIVRFVQDRTIG